MSKEEVTSYCNYTLIVASWLAIAALPAIAQEGGAEGTHTHLHHKIPVAPSDGAAGQDESWSNASSRQPRREFAFAPDGRLQSLDSGRMTLSVPDPTQLDPDPVAPARAANQVVLDANSSIPAGAGLEAGLAEPEFEERLIEAAQRLGVEPGLAAAIIAAEYYSGGATARRSRGTMVATDEPSDCDPAATMEDRIKLIGELSHELRSPLRVAAAYFARTRDRDGMAASGHPLRSCGDEAAGAAIPTEPSADTARNRRNAPGPARRQWVDGVMHF